MCYTICHTTPRKHPKQKKLVLQWLTFLVFVYVYIIPFPIECSRFCTTWCIPTHGLSWSFDSSELKCANREVGIWIRIKITRWVTATPGNLKISKSHVCQDYSCNDDHFDIRNWSHAQRCNQKLEKESCFWSRTPLPWTIITHIVNYVLKVCIVYTSNNIQCQRCQKE